MASGRKTLSDSEVLALSRNRHAERSLSDAKRRLSGEEQVIQERHQREILHWRDFRRRSIKTTGVWCTSFEDELSQDSSPSEENLHLLQDKSRGSGESGGGGSPVNSPRLKLNLHRPSNAGHSSTELARSLTFQNEALNKLQKPWAYTYSEASYNSVYNEAVQLSEGQKKKLYYRRASSASSPCTSPDHRTQQLRRRCSVDDFVSGIRRPSTGLTTPRSSRSSRCSRHRLSLCASVDKTRPKTSVGFVRPSKIQDKETSEQRRTNGQTLQSEPNYNQTGTKNDQELHSNTAQNNDRNYDTQGDVLDGLTNLAINTQDRNHAIDLTDGRPILDSSGRPNVISDAQDFIEQRDTNAMYCSEMVDTQMSMLYPSSKEAFHEDKIKEIHTHAKNDSDTNEACHDQASSSVLTNGLARLEKEKKSVHINLATEGKEVDGQSIEISARIAKYQQSSKDKGAEPSADSLKRDERFPSPSSTAAEAGTVTPSPPSSRRPKSRAGEHSRGNRRQSTSISYDRGTARRRSDVTELRHRSDLTSDSTTKTDGGRFNGSLSRRYSAIDVRRPSSVMKIVDQFEALREFHHHRMIPDDEDEDDDDDDDAKKDWSEKEVSGSPPRGLANKSGKGALDKDNEARQSTSTRRNSTSVGKSMQSDKENETQNVSSLPREKGSALPTSKLGSKDQQTDPNKTILTNTSGDTPELGSEIAQDGVMTVSSTKGTSSSTKTPGNPTSEIILFKGFKLRNYIRPQERYRGNTLAILRQEKPMLSASSENLVWSRKQNEMKPTVIFSKRSRQKVLQELVHRHHQPVKHPDNGVVPPQLRAKIDEFFKSIEPYCPKPDIVLD